MQLADSASSLHHSCRHEAQHWLDVSTPAIHAPRTLSHALALPSYERPNQFHTYKKTSERDKRRIQHANAARPSFTSEKFTENKDLKKWIDTYLDVGEWVMDKSVGIAAASGYFKHTR